MCLCVCVSAQTHNCACRVRTDLSGLFCSFVVELHGRTTCRCLQSRNAVGCSLAELPTAKGIPARPFACGIAARRHLHVVLPRSSATKGDLLLSPTGAPSIATLANAGLVKFLEVGQDCIMLRAKQGYIIQNSHYLVLCQFCLSASIRLCNTVVKSCQHASRFCRTMKLMFVSFGRVRVVRLQQVRWESPESRFTCSQTAVHILAS